MKNKQMTTEEGNAYQILDAKLKKLEKEFADFKKENVRSEKPDQIAKRA